MGVGGEEGASEQTGRASERREQGQGNKKGKKGKRGRGSEMIVAVAVVVVPVALVVVPVVCGGDRASFTRRKGARGGREASREIGRRRKGGRRERGVIDPPRLYGRAAPRAPGRCASRPPSPPPPPPPPRQFHSLSHFSRDSLPYSLALAHCARARREHVCEAASRSSDRRSFPCPRE